jgi:hypothetical protein
LAKLQLGSIVEDKLNDKLLGRYLVARLHLGLTIGNKFALISLTGTGVANGYHNSLEELEKATFSDSMVIVENYDDLQKEVESLRESTNEIKKILEEVNKQADTSAPGYDEGFYVGKGEGLEEVLNLLEENKK